MESKIRSFLVAIAFALAGGSFSVAHGASITALSGNEFFNGVRSGDGDITVTVGATFAGLTTHGGGTSWHPAASNNGGLWAVVVNYRGRPGIVPETENSVTVIGGGTWFLEGADGTTQSGKILSGKVSWPATLHANIGCQPGIAKFTVFISLLNSDQQAGEINGCLDDTHLDKVFPPKIWGTLQLN